MLAKLTKVHLIKSMVFPVVIYGCESWTIKKAEHRRIDPFELWCWKKLLRVPWTARRSNQSILKEISPEYSLEGRMLKLRFQYFGTWCEELTHLKRPWCWERLKADGDGNNRGWDGWMALPTQWTWVWVNSGSWWWTGKPDMLHFMGSQRVRYDWVTELNWQLTFELLNFQLTVDMRVKITYPPVLKILYLAFCIQGSNPQIHTTILCSSQYLLSKQICGRLDSVQTYVVQGSTVYTYVCVCVRACVYTHIYIYTLKMVFSFIHIFTCMFYMCIYSNMYNAKHHFMILIST